MFAIVETGGSQFRLEEGQILNVDKLAVEPGAEIVLDRVLMAGNEGDYKVGQPFIEGAKAVCEVVEHGRGEKIVVFHFWRRNDSRKKQGHRQDFTKIRVKSIQA